MAGALQVRGVQPARASTVVAIDFGSHGTGFAYSMGDAEPVKLHSAYPDAERRYPKMLTAILYKDRQPMSIGWTARKKYLRSQAPGAPNPGSYRLLTGFKLLLHDPESPLLQSLPPGLTVLQLIADFLSLFKKYVVTALRSALGPGSGHLLAPGAITWVLTVPALWTDRAKGVMRDACTRAGIMPRDRPEQLLLAVEPEAAALCARRDHARSFEAGRAVMVLDAGGGTVDWTVHNAITRGGQTVLAEAAIAVGHPLGSLQLDRAFLEYFREQVGEEAFTRWKDSHPLELLEVMGQWENIKCLFGCPETAPLHLAPGFAAQDCSRVTVPPGLQALVSDGMDSVMLTSKVIKRIFNPIIDEILRVTLEQIKEVGRLDKVLLVGGFSDAPYLQQRIRDGIRAADCMLLGKAPEVVAVRAPYAAVLQGAVLFGKDPTLIRSRKARYTYGVRYSNPYVEGALDKFWNHEKKAWFAGSYFKPYVVKGQSVEYDEAVTHTFWPLYKHQTSVDNRILVIDGPPPQFVDMNDPDTKELATVTVPIDATQRDKRDKQVDVKFSFGRAEVTASGTCKSTGAQTFLSFRFATT